jgi:hypothetical protein
MNASVLWHVIVHVCTPCHGDVYMPVLSLRLKPEAWQLSIYCNCKFNNVSASGAPSWGHSFGSLASATYLINTLVSFHQKLEKLSTLDEIKAGCEKS